MKRIYLDLETTGLDDTTSILEISARYYKDDVLVTSFDGKGFDQDAFINLEALKVNKYKLDKLRKDTFTEEQLLMDFFDWLLSIQDKVELAGINVQFDFNILKARALKYKIRVGSVLPYRLHDIGNISRFLQELGLFTVAPSGQGNTLHDLAIALGIQLDSSKLHSAAGDTDLYYPVDKKLKELAKQAMCQCKV